MKMEISKKELFQDYMQAENGFHQWFTDPNARLNVTRYLERQGIFRGTMAPMGDDQDYYSYPSRTTKGV